MYQYSLIICFKKPLNQSDNRPTYLFHSSHGSTCIAGRSYFSSYLKPFVLESADFTEQIESMVGSHMAVHLWQVIVIATLLPSYLTPRDHLLESAPPLLLY